jgi:hypothetical protein
VIAPPLWHQHTIAGTIADIEANIWIHRAIADRLGVLSTAVFGDMIQGREPA